MNYRVETLILKPRFLLKQLIDALVFFDIALYQERLNHILLPQIIENNQVGLGNFLGL